MSHSVGRESERLGTVGSYRGGVYLNDDGRKKLGRELGLFLFDPIAPGSPFFLPRGAIIYNELVAYIRRLYRRYHRHAHFSLASDGYCGKGCGSPDKSPGVVAGQAIASSGHVLDQAGKGGLGLVECHQSLWRRFQVRSKHADI